MWCNGNSIKLMKICLDVEYRQSGIKSMMYYVCYAELPYYFRLGLTTTPTKIFWPDWLPYLWIHATLVNREVVIMLHETKKINKSINVYGHFWVASQAARDWKFKVWVSNDKDVFSPPKITLECVLNYQWYNILSYLHLDLQAILYGQSNVSEISKNMMETPHDWLSVWQIPVPSPHKWPMMWK